MGIGTDLKKEREFLVVVRERKKVGGTHSQSERERQTEREVYVSLSEGPDSLRVENIQMVRSLSLWVRTCAAYTVSL